LRHLLEGSVMVVLIMNAVTVCSYEHIGPAVVIEITYSDAHAKDSATHARFLRYVSKCTVPIILVERVSNRFGGLPEIAGSAVDEVDVHPAVVIVIEESASRTQGFGQVTVVGQCVLVHPLDAASGCRHFRKQWLRLRGGRARQKRRRAARR